GQRFSRASAIFVRHPPLRNGSGLSCTSRGVGSRTDNPPAEEYMRQMPDVDKHFLQ
ncbi:unnamed protein product, partial [Ectocarpus sp. 12 AP-2014]